MAMTNRDREIVRYVEKYGFITIRQCMDMWFGTRKYGYDLSRKRLASIENDGYLKSFIDNSVYGSEKIFYIDKSYKTQSKHNIVIMNVHSELIKMGCDIIYFKKEQRWLDGKYKSDAYTIFRMNNFLYSVCIEVINTTKNFGFTKTNDEFNKKYSEIIIENDLPSEIIKTEMKNAFGVDYPYEVKTQLLVVDNMTHLKPWSIEGVEVKSVNFLLEKISTVLI